MHAEGPCLVACCCHDATGRRSALPLKQTSEAAFDEVMTINCKAPFFLIQAVADEIRDNGRIINVSTGFTRIAAPTHPTYAAFKGALETLTLVLAPEFAARGITVNALLPGVAETDMNAEWLASPDARAGPNPSRSSHVSDRRRRSPLSSPSSHRTMRVG